MNDKTKDLLLKIRKGATASMTPDNWVEALYREAREAGDEAQERLCEAALGGDDIARAACIDVIETVREERRLAE